MENFVGLFVLFRLQNEMHVWNILLQIWFSGRNVDAQTKKKLIINSSIARVWMRTNLWYELFARSKYHSIWWVATKWRRYAETRLSASCCFARRKRKRKPARFAFFYQFVHLLLGECVSEKMPKKKKMKITQIALRAIALIRISICALHVFVIRRRCRILSENPSLAAIWKHSTLFFGPDYTYIHIYA